MMANGDIATTAAVVWPTAETEKSSSMPIAGWLMLLSSLSPRASTAALMAKKTTSAQIGKRKPPIPMYTAVRVLTYSLLVGLARREAVTVASRRQPASYEQAEAMQIPSVLHTV
jgi:hypothetical protein